MDISMRKLNHAEQSQKVLPLLGICFPNHWKVVADTCREMPFEEISFGAFDGETLVGHCGLVPHDIYFNGSWYPVAGVASVAVSPTHQKMGIAKNLCDFAAKWAEEQGFLLMPLYTEFFRVYEVCNWQKFAIPATVEPVSVFNNETAVWKSGSELTETEKELIISLYENGENFNGKIKRLLSGKLQSWDRIFCRGNRFAVNPQMYASTVDGVLAEIYFAPGTADDEKRGFFRSLGTLPCYLPQTESVKMLMADYDWQISDTDAMHGERPMIRLPRQSNALTENPESIFFALPDKF